MATIRLDGLEFEAPDQTVSAFKLALERKDGETKIQADRADAAEGERDGFKSDLDKAQDPQVRQDAVSARVKLCLDAGKLLGNEKLDSLSDDEIRSKAVTKSDPDLVLDGKSPVYVEALFDRAVAAAAKRNDGLQKTAETKPVETREDESDPLDARRNSHANYMKGSK